MPRFRPVDRPYPDAQHDAHRPDRREKPWRHPLGWTREMVALVKYNTHVRQREQAIEDARAAGSLVRVPPNWSRGERVLPPANVHQGTAYLRLPALQLAPIPLAEVLDARRPLVAPAEPTTPASGTFVDMHRRWVEHDRAMQRAASGALDAHDRVRGDELSVGLPVAVVTATSGSSRARVTSTHVVRIEELLGPAWPTVDAARERAQHALMGGDELAPLALVRGAGGVRVARLTSSSLAIGRDGEPLVGSLAASGMSLDWRGTTSSLVAVLGIDGVRWFS